MKNKRVKNFENFDKVNESVVSSIMEILGYAVTGVLGLAGLSYVFYKVFGKNIEKELSKEKLLEVYDELIKEMDKQYPGVIGISEKYGGIIIERIENGKITNAKGLLHDFNFLVKNLIDIGAFEL